MPQALDHLDSLRSAAEEPSNMSASAGLSLQPFVSIVIPTFREADNICELVRRIHEALKFAYPTYEVLVVDDDSQDGIEQHVARLQEECYPVRLIVRTQQRGLSSAVLCGFAEAVGDVLVCLDADLSHPPEKLPQIIACTLQENVDFVLGSRYVQQGSVDGRWGRLRRWNSRIATMLARPFSQANDPLSGYFALLRERYEACAPLDPIGYKIGLELLVKAGCQRVAEVPIEFRQRQRGESKLSLMEQLRYLRHLGRLAAFKYAAAVQFVQFCLIGATGMAVDLLSYVLLLLLGLPLGPARAAAIWLAMNWNFAVNRDLTFHQHGCAGVARSYGRFLCACALGALVSWSVSMLLPIGMAFFHLHPVGAAAVGVVAGTLINFQLSRLWAFRLPFREA